jgi:tetratricopeptide (TPR) repeat protein
LKLTLDEALQKGIEAHKTGQIQDAERFYTAVLKAQHKHPDANHNMGVLAVGVGKSQEALAFFKVALEEKPSNGQFWVSYIDALIKLGQIADAQAVFSQAKHKGASGDAFDHLEQQLLEQGLQANKLDIIDTTDLDKALRLAKRKIKDDQPKEAKRIYEDILQKFPKHKQALAALKSLTGGATITPQNPPSGQLKPIINLYNHGQLQQALFVISQLLEKFPNSVTLHQMAGASNAGLMKFDAAIDSYKNAIKINPNFAEDYYNIGTIFGDKGDVEAAMESYKMAIKIKPDFSEAHYNQGVCLFECNQIEKAVNHFKTSDFGRSKYYFLTCLYLQDKKFPFYEQLDYFINQDEIDPMIGSLGCRAELRYGIEKRNLFCKDPLNYVLKNNLSNQYDFDKIFVNTTKIILNENRVPTRAQGLLTNGYQTFGNLFSLQPDLTEDIQRIIRLEIEKYRDGFKHSKEGLITSWPAEYSLYGWLISMKSGGQLRPHMHEKGWISGSIYINVPSKSTAESGNLVVCIEEDDLSDGNINQRKSIDVVTGSLCLFPASLYHYTIPFESEEKRIVLAFDVISNN